MLWQQPHIKLSFHEVKLKVLSAARLYNAHRCLSSKPWVRAACAHQPAKLLFGVVHGWAGGAESHGSREQVSIREVMWIPQWKSIHNSCFPPRLPTIRRTLPMHVLFIHQVFFSDLVDDLSRASRIQTGSQNSYKYIYIYICVIIIQ